MEQISLVHLQSLLGIIAFLFIAWIVSENRREIAWRTVITGLLIQVSLVLILTHVPAVQTLFHILADGVHALQAASHEGVVFVFGYLGGGPLPFETNGTGSPYIIAFQVLPLILLVGALSALLWHWKILIVLVRAGGWVMERAFKVGGGWFTFLGC